MPRPIALIGTPTSAGAFSPGQEKAPAALRAAGIIDALESRGLAVRDAGNVAGFHWRPDRSSPRAQNVQSVIAGIAATQLLVGEALQRGEFAVVMGGDCTVGLAAMEAIRGRGEQLGVLYLDHDSDMNTPSTTESGAVDQMTLACALGIDGCVPGVATVGLLDPAHLVLVGFGSGQSTDSELRTLRQLGVSIVDAETTDRAPAEAARRALAALPHDTTGVAIHFDVDVVDFMDAPLSEDPNRNLGIRLDSALTCLQMLAADRRDRAVTITELNPDHGAAGGSTLRGFVDGFANATARAMMSA